MAAWDLIVVDEAHRVSGRIGKPWTVVHDNQKIPSLRRLYMTATPRLWQLGDEDEVSAPDELVASMEDDPEGPFGSRCFTLTLSEAIDRGICAPYQVVCVDVTHTALQAALVKRRPRRACAGRSCSTTRPARPKRSRPAFRASPRNCTPPTRSCTRRRSGRTGCAATTSRSTGVGCWASSRPGSPRTAPWLRSASCAR
ncbi:DEAD/DEAH box helicase family protein [Streptomyces geysiriensis]|nr:DEAD/DEAH box helicase family protein [Streptomyces sp. RT42]MBX4173545.1 DEAD/DEAH box helicase family protein [Streptomyces geysiriensis]